MHNVEELAELVDRMRQAQRLYFAHRANAALALARHLERQVDAVLDDILSELYRSRAEVTRSCNEQKKDS